MRKNAAKTSPMKLWCSELTYSGKNFAALRTNVFVRILLILGHILFRGLNYMLVIISCLQVVPKCVICDIEVSKCIAIVRRN